MTLRQRASKAEVIIITGLSGAGRSEAAKAFEDLGWFVIDNLPPALIKTMLSLAFAPGNDLRRVAVAIDVRGGGFFTDAMDELEKIRRDICNYRLVFLEADDDVLVRRFETSRRRHPLGSDERVADGIRRERDMLRALREGADLVLDTTDLTVRELRSRLASFFGGATDPDDMRTTIISFGYKFGLPLDADLVLDVRFLPNPHWVDELRPLTGRQEPVRAYVLGQPETKDFLERARELLGVLLPGYHKEGRHYLTLAVGCTGGRHRSVVLADEIAAAVRDLGFTANVIHRDADQDPAR